MRKLRVTDEQMVAIEAEYVAGVNVEEFCRKRSMERRRFGCEHYIG